MGGDDYGFGVSKLIEPGLKLCANSRRLRQDIDIATGGLAIASGF